VLRGEVKQTAATRQAIKPLFVSKKRRSLRIRSFLTEALFERTRFV
jgi:hypothetical protein